MAPADFNGSIPRTRDRGSRITWITSSNNADEGRSGERWHRGLKLSRASHTVDHLREEGGGRDKSRPLEGQCFDHVDDYEPATFFYPQIVQARRRSRSAVLIAGNEFVGEILDPAL
jgi:hypothetical protein